ncbi:MAG: Zn-ribbon domain-containing OB-fold protein [Acidimicrobiia bacterium]
MTTAEQPQVFSPPLPLPDARTQFFWDGVEAHKLLILRCDSCGTYIHLPRDICRVCHSTSLTPTEVSGRAVLSTWTMPSQPFDPYYATHLPYVLAVVELVEQKNLKMVTNIVDCDEADLRIEMPLEVTFREVAPGCTLPLFKPVG